MSLCKLFLKHAFILFCTEHKLKHWRLHLQIMLHFQKAQECWSSYQLLILCIYLGFVCLDVLKSCPGFSKLILCALVQSLLCTKFSVTWLKSVIAKAGALAIAKCIVLCFILFLCCRSQVLQPPVSCTSRIKLDLLQERLAALSRALSPSLLPRGVFIVFSSQLRTINTPKFAIWTKIASLCISSGHCSCLILQFPPCYRSPYHIFLPFMAR